MFSCCRCKNPKKQNKYMKNGDDDEEEEEEEEEEEDEDDEEEETEGEDSEKSNNKSNSISNDAGDNSTIKENGLVSTKTASINDNHHDEKQSLDDNDQRQSESESNDDSGDSQKNLVHKKDNIEKEQEKNENLETKENEENQKKEKKEEEGEEENQNIKNDNDKAINDDDKDKNDEQSDMIKTAEEYDLDEMNKDEDTMKTARSKSDSSNSTIEESIVLNNKIKNNELDKDVKENNIVNNDDDNDDDDSRNDVSIDSVPNDIQNNEMNETSLNSCNITSNKDINDYTNDNDSNTTSNDNKDDTKSSDTTIINGDLPKSCISRRSSSKSSIQKRVNINDSTEVIPSSELASINDDDEVFSDSIPAKLPRGDMCTPYNAKSRSIPTYYGLPEWFNNDDRFYDEQGGSQEPPVTPVGRDELALKRHRMYSELLMAAQAAVEHRVRFDPLGPDVATTDCDPDLKPSTTYELENLVNRLEKLIDRLERTVSARELEIANKTFDSVIETKRRSIDLETVELPSIPNHVNNEVTEVIGEKSEKLNRSKEIEEIDTTVGSGSNSSSNKTTSAESAASKKENKISANLEARIDRIEASLNHINNNYRRESEEDEEQEEESSLENIPTVLDEYLSEDNQNQNYHQSPVEELLLDNDNMSVAGYQDIINGPLAQYIALSNKIGGDVAKHAQYVKAAFDAQLQYINYASQYAQPPQSKQMELLKPTSDQITAIQDFREKNRASQLFNHLSAISESIPALGWVCISPTPGPHVKEMNDAGQFYTNRVLKEWKEKDLTHVEWARAWIQTLTDLQKYIKQYHTTGLVWSGKGSAAGVGGGSVPPPPPPSAFGCPPPPPPPVAGFGELSLSGGSDDRSALFAEINQGEAITKNLKKVTADMQTHKNPTLRTGPAPFKAPQYSTSPTGNKPAVQQQQVDRSPVFARDGKKWLIEYQKSNHGLLVENAEMNNVVYMYRCQDSTLTIKGKINSIVMDSCKKCSILFDSVVSSVEFVNCQSVQMQVLAKVPTISIDKTDGCQMYLSKDSLAVEIISSKSSEMNVLIPKDNGDYVEQPIPEQYKTTIHNNALHTVCVESLG